MFFHNFFTDFFTTLFTKFPTSQFRFFTKFHAAPHTVHRQVFHKVFTKRFALYLVCSLGARRPLASDRSLHLPGCSRIRMGLHGPVASPVVCASTHRCLVPLGGACQRHPERKVGKGPPKQKFTRKLCHPG